MKTSSRPSGSSWSPGRLGTCVPWLENENTTWSPGLAFPTIVWRADITFFLVASLSVITCTLRAGNPTFFKCLEMSLASLTQPLSQLLLRQ